MERGKSTELLNFFYCANKMVAVLIDPDNRNFGQLEALVNLCNRKAIDLFMVGGSILSEGVIEETITFIKLRSKIPVIIFPGSSQQICNKADGIFLLSLISGRNADLLIGKHVESSFKLKASELEVMPTGYILIDGGKPTTASYISFTQPLPNNKPMLAAATALAGEQLGLKLIYLDAGSGAEIPVSVALIQGVRKHISLPIIVGGGLRTKKDIQNAFDAGANMVVLGNILENNPEILDELI